MIPQQFGTPIVAYHKCENCKKESPDVMLYENKMSFINLKMVLCPPCIRAWDRIMFEKMKTFADETQVLLHNWLNGETK